jgi:oligoendopeptidase F
MKVDKVLLRENAPEESIWNPQATYASWAVWESEYEEVLTRLPELGEFEGRLGEGPATVLGWLKLYQSISRRTLKLFWFAQQAYRVDTNDPASLRHLDQARSLHSRFNSLASFAKPELAGLGETLLEWAGDEPELTDYEHYFHNLLRLAPHRRSSEVEEILSMLELPFSGPSRTFSALTNTDMRFHDAVDSQGTAHAVTQTTIPPTGIQSPDRERRRTAWESYCDGYLALQNTLASNYISLVHQQVFLARVRGYNSVLEMRLSANNLPVGVFENVISTFQANLPLWHRYWEVRRRVLGLEDIRPYDRWAQFATDQPAVPYRKAVEWIGEAVAPLGPDYVEVMRRGCLQDRWVDYYPNLGKQSGAWTAAQVDQPPYITMSYDDSLLSASILAHELGHALHAHLTDLHQPDVYCGYDVLSSTVAETASNFNQALLRAYLIAEKGDDVALQLALADETLWNFHRYFFIMPTLARFEFEVFSRAEKDKALTAEDLNHIMAGLFAEGYGSTLTDDPERTAITWAQFMQLNWPFYTFQYAVGISAATALANGVLADQANSAENYLKFLRAGGSQYPTDLFKLAGLDMNSPEPVEAAFQVLAQAIERLEALSI